MPDIKYSKAVYRDKTSGNLVTIYADDLKKSTTLADARLNELYDDSEQTRLKPRFGDTNVPHFAVISSGGRNILQGERNKDHDDRVNYLSNTLSTIASWDLGMIGIKKKDGPPPDFKKENVLFDYRWGSEINRIMDEKTIVRHDIFGSSKEISMSIRQPSIAIEVINTHYPEEEAFLAFLEKSKREPFIVFFDVIQFNGKKFNNYFISSDTQLKRISYRWCTYSIRDGKVYKGNQVTDINTSTRMRIEVEKMLTNWK